MRRVVWLNATVPFFVIAYGLSWAWVIPLALTGHTVFQGRGMAQSLPELAWPHGGGIRRDGLNHRSLREALLR